MVQNLIGQNKARTERDPDRYCFLALEAPFEVSGVLVR
jgi:hypothetical protein